MPLTQQALPPICQRCGTLLTPGKGDFYVIHLHAHAEAAGPVITAEHLQKDHATEMQNIADDLANISPQEAMDSVYRQLQFFLCRPCYKIWIENPTG